MDGKFALELQNYSKSLKDFDTAIHSLDGRDLGGDVVGRAAMDTGEHVS